MTKMQQLIEKTKYHDRAINVIKLSFDLIDMDRYHLI